ncbi:hypothetical protein ACIQCF_37450 [Streptomyces sp. NPDC088353]|uniref:hypothetical protein n=1 Tax=Streptomyces sp. NPDC088353 TaxID=3365855 RepID=UPI0037F59AD5
MRRTALRSTLKGKITVTLPTDFPNNRKLIILQHGGASRSFTDSAREIKRTDEQIIEIETGASRSRGEAVELRLAVTSAGSTT